MYENYLRNDSPEILWLVEHPRVKEIVRDCGSCEEKMLTKYSSCPSIDCGRILCPMCLYSTKCSGFRCKFILCVQCQNKNGANKINKCTYTNTACVERYCLNFLRDDFCQRCKINRLCTDYYCSYPDRGLCGNCNAEARQARRNRGYYTSDESSDEEQSSDSNNENDDVNDDNDDDNDDDDDDNDYDDDDDDDDDGEKSSSPRNIVNIDSSSPFIDDNNKQNYDGSSPNNNRKRNRRIQLISLSRVAPRSMQYNNTITGTTINTHKCNGIPSPGNGPSPGMRLLPPAMRFVPPAMGPPHPPSMHRPSPPPPPTVLLVPPGMVPPPLPPPLGMPPPPSPPEQGTSLSAIINEFWSANAP